MSNGLLNAALSYTASGISVIPMLDKQPHPNLLPRNETGKIEWTPYQLGIAPVATIQEWFGPANAMAVVTGAVSGNLHALDFDVRPSVDAYHEYLGLLAQLDPDLANLPQERTPGGGIHVYFRAPEVLSSATLAKTAEGLTLIELKGAASCLNCSPSPSYSLQVSSLLSVPTLSGRQMNTLLRIAQSITRVLPAQKKPPSDPKDGPASRFDATHSVSDMLSWLLKAGWRIAATSRGVTYLTRPGKDRGISATLGWNGLPILRNFSGNSGLEQRAYGAFGLYSALNHDGNHREAAREILRSEPPQHPQFLRDVSEPSLQWDDVPEPTEEAGEESNETPPEAEKKERKGYRVLSGDQLLSMPPVAELIEGWLLKAPAFMMYAKAGVGKTFAAMDMALCIASGKPWHGHAVVQGPVLYIAAEGAYGIGQRYRAWRQQYHNNQAVPDFHLISHPVFPTWEETLGLIKETIAENGMVGLQAIIIDTLAQCFGEGDESDNHDSQMFLSAVAAIHQETGATVGLVHHSGWDESRLRGASNFRNSVDTVIQLKEGEDAMHFTMLHDKIKDLEKATPISFERIKIGPNKEDSCYIQPLGVARKATARLTVPQVAILDVLSTSSFEGCHAAELMQASSLARSTFFRTLFELVKGNLILSTGEEKAKTRTHRITEGGRKALEMHRNS